MRNLSETNHNCRVALGVVQIAILGGLLWLMFAGLDALMVS